MKIEVSERTFKRMQKHAVPLQDSTDDLLKKLLDVYEGKELGMQSIPEFIDELLPEEMQQARRRLTGFAGELWDSVISVLPVEFSLQDVYDNLDVLRVNRPHIKELEATARTALQKLRDAGYLVFLDNRGRYKKRF